MQLDISRRLGNNLIKILRIQMRRRLKYSEPNLNPSVI